MSYFGLITRPEWPLMVLAYIGTGLVPALGLALVLPDMVERVRTLGTRYDEHDAAHSAAGDPPIRWWHHAVILPLAAFWTVVDLLHLRRDAREGRDWGAK